MKRIVLACLAIIICILPGCGDDSNSPQPNSTQSDTTAPVITAFAMPATATGLTVAVTIFTATDDTGITGYMIKEDSTTPVDGVGAWSITPPTSYTFSSTGTKTAYAWVCDAAGNVSLAAQVQITLLPQPTQAVLKLSSQGTLTGATSLSGIGITVTLPDGVSVKTDAGGIVDTGVVALSGVAVQGILVTPISTPASVGVKATVSFAVASSVAGGFTVGEFAIVTCDLAAGFSPTAADFTLSNFSPADLFLQPVASLTPSLSLELK